MISKIVISLVISGLVTIVVIPFINILIKKDEKYISLLLVATCAYAAIASVREIGVVWRILVNSDLLTKIDVIGTILVCIIIFWLPSMVVVLYRKEKMSRMRMLDELEMMKIKEM